MLMNHSPFATSKAYHYLFYLTHTIQFKFQNNLLIQEPCQEQISNPNKFWRQPYAVNYKLLIVFAKVW